MRYLNCPRRKETLSSDECGRCHEKNRHFETRALCVLRSNANYLGEHNGKDGHGSGNTEGRIGDSVEVSGDGSESIKPAERTEERRNEGGTPVKRGRGRPRKVISTLIPT